MLYSFYMLKAIIEKLNTIYPTYSLESFTPEIALLNASFLVVDLGEKEVAGKFSHQPLFIYIYTAPNTHTLSKNIKKKVQSLLHKNKIAKKTSEGFFWVEYSKEVFTKFDDTIKKQCLCLEFKIPTI